MPISRPSTSTLFALSVSASMAVGFALFPLISDDLRSFLCLRSSYLFGESIDWDAYFANVRDIFAGNHFRLPNLLMPLLILLPRWLLAAVSGLALYAVIDLGGRIGGFRDNTPRMCVLSAAMVFCFPWIDQLYLVSFQVPYLWGAVFALWFVRMLFKGRSLWIFAVGALVGFWHEAYAGALLGGCVCLMAFISGYRTRRVMYGSLGLLCGIAVVAMPIVCY